MRIIFLTNGQLNQMALAHRISSVAEVVAVIVSANVPRVKPGFTKSQRLRLNALAGRTVGKPMVDAWKEMLEDYAKEFTDFPAQVIKVDNVNDRETIDLIVAEKPDLVVVSGTNLVGSKVIETAKGYGGIVNLHTGISPYVKGGPNCTNWCLAKGWFDRIGNTIMWLDRGIDTGDIITTERTVLDGGESLTQLHRKVMDHGHDLYVKVLERIARVGAVPSVSQTNISKGNHFNNVDWTFFEMRHAMLNYRRDYKTFFSDRTRKATNVDDFRVFPLTDD